MSANDAKSEATMPMGTPTLNVDDEIPLQTQPSQQGISPAVTQQTPVTLNKTPISMTPAGLTPVGVSAFTPGGLTPTASGAKKLNVGLTPISVKPITLGTPGGPLLATPQTTYTYKRVTVSTTHSRFPGLIPPAVVMARPTAFQPIPLKPKEYQGSGALGKNMFMKGFEMPKWFADAQIKKVGMLDKEGLRMLRR